MLYRPAINLFSSRSRLKILALIVATQLAAVGAPTAEPYSPPSSDASPGFDQLGRPMSLEECLAVAMQKSRRRPASRLAVVMAEAQHRQALSGYWPQIGATAGFRRLDESPNFIFPASSFSVNSLTVDLPLGGSIPVTIPGVGTVPVTAFQIPAQSIQIPEQDITVAGRDTTQASLNAMWLLYDGGLRSGYRQQSDAFTAMMKQEARRTDLEITDSVKRLYYGAVLASKLRQLGLDTLSRMEVTLNLTEAMFKEGSGRVKKTDFLDNKIVVETLRSMMALLEQNQAIACAALANTMGLSWNASVQPAEKELLSIPLGEDLNDLVASAYQFNPDWGKIEAGLRAAEGAIKTARSGHSPKVAVTGELHRWWNNGSSGLATPRNEKGWSVGVGLEVPLFDGFLTRNKVAEARARLAKIKEEQFLLREGIGLQIRAVFIGLNGTSKAHRATQEAMVAAQENRELNTRAYQNELVDTEKVIRAQLMEALMSAQHYKISYDHVALQSQLQLLVGSEIANKLIGP